MFTKIAFQNLRCFKDFTLGDMTPLTLISGRNNIGKTTLLEGIFLLLGYRDAHIFNTIKNCRGLDNTVASQNFLAGINASLWEILFSNMDMTQALCISMTDDMNITRRLSLTKDEQFSLTTFAEQNKMQLMLQSNSGSYALKFVYESGTGTDEIGRFLLTHLGVALNFDALPHLPVPPFALYIGPNTNLPQQTVVEWLGKIELKNTKELLVRNLRLLCEELEDIFTVSQHGNISIFSRLQTGKTLPIRTMGDGINKLLHYLSVMIANPGGVFLLDEIETGFHYSFYPKLWELIAAVTKDTGSQVIATTHSYECISAAVEGTTKIDPALLTYVRLGREETEIIPYSFAKDDLTYALAREMEVR